MEQNPGHSEIALNVIIGMVITVGVLLIFITATVLRRWYNIYKIEKYVKEENERKKAERPGDITARGKW